MSPEQELFLGRIEALLEERGARFDTRVHGDALEPWVELRLVLPAERGLTVRVVVAPDVFAFVANGAQLRLERVDFGDDHGPWSEACARTLSELMSSELRIRLRRTLVGGVVGAVRVPRPDGSREVWNGDLLAWMGLGRPSSFADWWRPPD